MSGMQLFKKAVVAALCEHPDAEKYQQRAFSGEGLDSMARFNGAAAGLRKEDLFLRDDAGRCFADGKGFWKNFAKIGDILARGGESFRPEDLSRPVGGAGDDSRTLLDSARDNGALDKAFTAKIWAGRYDEMEVLWHKQPFPSRRDVFGNEGALSMEMKRAVLATENRIPPEDRLAKSGLRLRDLHLAFQDSAGYGDLKEVLALRGDYLRKEYLLLPDPHGDTVFCNKRAWDNYGDMTRVLAAHGERLEVSDFLRQVGTVNNVLTRAASFGALDKVFAPAHWAGRLEEMGELWGHVLGGWKSAPMTPEAFDGAYARAESLTFGPVSGHLAVRGEGLLSPIGAVGGKPVYMTGLSDFWENVSVVEKHLSARGEKLTLDNLRRGSGLLGYSPMMNAAKTGHFPHVLRLARETGLRLTAADFLAKDLHGNTVLDILANRKELSAVFTPRVWVGHLEDMKAVYAHVRVRDKGQVDIGKLEVAVRQETLRSQAGERPRLRLRPPGKNGN